uniref:transporter substrate-binding domain-containing protein n=2 Tax=Pseudomonas TaxID=286 RepID=UPI003FD6D166
MPRLSAIIFFYMIGVTATANALTLSDEEHTWLSSHKELRLGVDATWPPFEFRDENGRYQGLAADYVALIEQRLAVSLQPIKPVGWNEVLNKAKRGEIDLLPGIMSTPERQNYLSFTRPYLDFPIVILAH